MTRTLLALLAFYKRWLSPALHWTRIGGCKYLPTCSEYAHIALLRHGALYGSLLAVWRVLRCNPFSAGGYDPVPPTHCQAPDCRLHHSPGHPIEPSHPTRPGYQTQNEMILR